MFSYLPEKLSDILKYYTYVLNFDNLCIDRLYLAQALHNVQMLAKDNFRNEKIEK